jgi:hypothetical protein
MKEKFQTKITKGEKQVSDNNGALSNDFQGFCLSNISTDATYNKGAAAADAALVGVCCWTDIPAESNNRKLVFLTFLP